MTVEQRPSGLGAYQVRLLRRSRAFLRLQRRRGVDVAVSPECYLNCWGRVPGNARVRSLARQRGATIGLLVARAREAALVAGQSGYEVATGKGGRRPFERLVVSWSRGSDFASDGAYRDRYFRTGSRETPSTLWFLISIDDVAPQILDPNVILFRRSPGTRRLDFFFLMRSAFSNMIRGRRPNGVVPKLSATVSFADQVTRAVMATIEAEQVGMVVMPYEGQPFQHAIFRAAKQRDPKVRTIGYLHSALPPVPTDLIHRLGAPELLMVHGRGQTDILLRDLGWSSPSLRTIPALRFRVSDPATLAGFVFLPYHFDNPDVIEAAFREFVGSCATGTLPDLVVRNHPLMSRSRAHAELTQKLEAIMRSNAHLISLSRAVIGTSVFIGATAAILEALERGVEAIHICSQPLTESHCPEIWRNLQVERLGEHLFRYRLLVRGTYIQFGTDSDSLESCLEADVG